MYHDCDYGKIILFRHSATWVRTFAESTLQETFLDQDFEFCHSTDISLVLDLVALPEIKIEFWQRPTVTRTLTLGPIFSSRLEHSVRASVLQLGFSIDSTFPENQELWHCVTVTKRLLSRNILPETKELFPLFARLRLLFWTLRHQWHCPRTNSELSGGKLSDHFSVFPWLIA